LEKIIKFKNNEGIDLIGIMHYPTDAQAYVDSKPGIIMLSPGLKDRSGPHRLYIKIARILTDHGYTVLRFDPSGIGDSGGEFKMGLSLESFVLIEKGRFVKDAKAAVDFFIDKTGIKKIIFIGLCGGAITAILTASIDARIDGLILLDIPIILDTLLPISKFLINKRNINSFFNKIQHNTNKQALIIGFKLIDKLTQIMLWIENIFFRKRILNKLFLKAFDINVCRNKKIIFIESDLKPIYEINEKREFWHKHVSKINNYLEVVTVEDANHEFASLKAQDAVLNKIIYWLKDNFS